MTITSKLYRLRGPHDPTAAYHVGDVVYAGRSTYQCITDVPEQCITDVPEPPVGQQNPPPAQDRKHWKMLV